MAVRPLFSVQKHDATRLHYDFRLEHDGVLWSWAVPKGPSLDPKDKRLAMHVEDHSREYATFAGRIPAGQYGAGVLEVWDHGTWVPLGDATADLAEGEMKFELDGTRLHGRFVLVRLKQRPKERAENGLLIKEHDAHEQPGTDVAAMEATHTPALSPQREKKKTKLPRTQRPQLATLVEQPSEAGSWMSEIKFDGYRLLAFKDGASVRLITRNGLDWTHRLPSLARIIAQMSLNTALLDGELVALRPDGVSSFPELQSALGDGRDDKLVFYVFDLLHHDGRDLLPQTRCKHVRPPCVVPVVPSADWTTVRTWCRAFVETMAAEAPDRFVTAVSKSIRRGHILIDWLRTGLGSTAVASFSPRARPGVIHHRHNPCPHRHAEARPIGRVRRRQTPTSPKEHRP